MLLCRRRGLQCYHVDVAGYNVCDYNPQQETCKCNVVTWTAQYICGAIALGYIVTVAPKVGNRFPTKVSSKTNEKETLFVSGKLQCNDPTKETTIVCDFLVTVDSLQWY